MSILKYLEEQSHYLESPKSMVLWNYTYSFQINGADFINMPAYARDVIKPWGRPAGGGFATLTWDFQGIPQHIFKKFEQHLIDLSNAEYLETMEGVGHA